MTTVSWRAMVDAAEARQHVKPKDICYQFSSGRKFERGEDPYSWADGSGSGGAFPFVFDLEPGDSEGDIDLS